MSETVTLNQERAAGPESRGKTPQDLKTTVNSQQILSQFNIAFTVMSILPLLTCFWLVTVRFFSISILEGLNGFYFLLAIVLALLGMLRGRQVLGSIIRQLVAANSRLAQVNQLQADFVGHVAHELRAPLTVIKGALDNLGDGLHGALTDEQREPVAMSQRETLRIKRLTGDLLGLAQMEAGRVRLELEELSLGELLRSLVQTYGGLVRERGLTLVLEAPDDTIRVVADRDRLSQVFVNLLTNAAKFTKRGSVTLQLTREADQAQVVVADTGPGIPSEDLARIFEKFERSGDQKTEGAGLGLSIARAMVELHHGRIEVNSELGRGSRFIVRLPLAGSITSSHR